MVGPVVRGARPGQRGSLASAPDPDLQESQNAHALAREIGGGVTLATAAGPGTLTATKLIGVALQNAASIAGLMVTTECLVTELPEKAKTSAMPAGGGGI
jgi:hypothetical protein